MAGICISEKRCFMGTAGSRATPSGPWDLLAWWLALGFVWLGSGCAELRPAQFHWNSDILAGQSFAYAVYSNQHRLLTDPLSELEAETAGKPISDIYVISHGWNFTSSEALANYHGYLQLLDQHLKSIQNTNPQFHPYFILVVWPSVSRPLEDAAQSLIPFDLDRAIQGPARILDSVLFHIPSAWKESLNASAVALGTRWPEEYRRRKLLPSLPWSYRPDMPSEERADQRTPPPHCGPITEAMAGKKDLYEIDTDEAMGRDCPVSTLIYQIMQWRSGRRATPNEPIRLHLVGHSYGAKVVALAGMEALRIWSYNGANWPEPVTTRSKSEDSGPELKLPKPLEEDTIQSLILVNPAFHPRELIYYVKLDVMNPFFLSNPASIESVAPVENLLKAIPRKAIVYSKWDYATGRLFDLSQVLGHNGVNQLAEQMQRGFVNWTPSRAPVQAVSYFLTGSLQVVSSLVNGVQTWTLGKLFFLPWDLVYHVSRADLYGCGKDQAQEGIVCKWAWKLRYLWRPVDYVVPLGHLFTEEESDKQGILRPTVPALGSTGLMHLDAGRELWRKGPLQALAISYGNLEPLDKLVPGKDPWAAHRTAQGFCDLGAKPGKQLPGTEVYPQYIYSYDGSLVLDTGTPGAGAHGDVRSTAPPKNCVHEIPTDDHSKTRYLEKREYIMNFVYNFSQGKVVEERNKP